MIRNIRLWLRDVSSQWRRDTGKDRLIPLELVTHTKSRGIRCLQKNNLVCSPIPLLKVLRPIEGTRPQILNARSVSVTAPAIN